MNRITERCYRVVMSTVLSYVLASLDLELNNALEYATELEQSLSDTANRLARSLEATAAKLVDVAAVEDLYDWHNDDLWRLTTVFPAMMRSSLFVSCYSLLEHRLNDLCGVIQRERKLALTPKELDGDGIFRSKVYLNKVVGIEFADGGGTPWDSIWTRNKLRNAIVHTDGRLTEEAATKLAAFFKQNTELLKLSPRRQIDLGVGFCPHFIQTIRKFFHLLIAELEKAGLGAKEVPAAALTPAAVTPPVEPE